MCSPAVCRQCNKQTYTGCGQHLDQVFRGVPMSERCDCSSGAPAQRSIFGFGRR